MLINQNPIIYVNPTERDLQQNITDAVRLSQGQIKEPFPGAEIAGKTLYAFRAILAKSELLPTIYDTYVWAENGPIHHSVAGKFVKHDPAWIPMYLEYFPAWDLLSIRISPNSIYSRGKKNIAKKLMNDMNATNKSISQGKIPNPSTSPLIGLVKKAPFFTPYNVRLKWNPTEMAKPAGVGVSEDALMEHTQHPLSLVERILRSVTKPPVKQ